MRLTIDIPDNATAEEIRSIINRATESAMDDAWIDQDGDVYIQTPCAQAAEMAEEMEIDYSYALVLCNCD